MTQDKSQNQTRRSGAGDTAEAYRHDAAKHGKAHSFFALWIFGGNLLFCVILVIAYWCFAPKGTSILKESYLLLPWLAMLGVINAPLFLRANFHGKQTATAQQHRFQALGMGSKYDVDSTSADGTGADTSASEVEESPIPQ